MNRIGFTSWKEIFHIPIKSCLFAEFFEYDVHEIFESIAIGGIKWAQVFSSTNCSCISKLRLEFSRNRLLDKSSYFCLVGLACFNKLILNTWMLIESATTSIRFICKNFATFTSCIRLD